ncbi:MAG: LicD family protein [Hungatella sp.]
MTYDLTKVHETNLKILKEVDRICRKYKIQYLLDAGTLLGAVRHRGFIPWDDDADLAFTRNNYEAFQKVVKRELPEGMSFVDCRSFRDGKAFYDFTPRIMYDRSKTDEDTPQMRYYEGKLNHLWVDLFILDELPEHKVSAAWTLFLHKAVYGLSMGHRYRLDYRPYSPFHKLAVGALAIVGKLIPMKVLFRMQELIAKKDRKGKSNLLYYSNYQPDYLYVTLQKEWCVETVDLDFAGEKLMAPSGWEQVLTWIYGDYRKLPPEDQRIPAHSSMEIQILD